MVTRGTDGRLLWVHRLVRMRIFILAAGFSPHHHHHLLMTVVLDVSSVTCPSVPLALPAAFLPFRLLPTPSSAAGAGAGLGSWTWRQDLHMGSPAARGVRRVTARAADVNGSCRYRMLVVVGWTTTGDDLV